MGSSNTSEGSANACRSGIEDAEHQANANRPLPRSNPSCSAKIEPANEKSSQRSPALIAQDGLFMVVPSSIPAELNSTPYPDYISIRLIKLMDCV